MQYGQGMQGGPGMQGGNQSPFAGGKGDGAEGVAQQFYDKLMAGEMDGMEDLFSSKAAGKAKAFREGKASENMVNEMKSAFTNVRLSSSKQVQNTRILLLEENGGNQNAQPAGGYGQGRGDRTAKKAGKKVQVKVISEGGKFVIQDIVVRG